MCVSVPITKNEQWGGCLENDVMTVSSVQIALTTMNPEPMWSHLKIFKKMVMIFDTLFNINSLFIISAMLLALIVSLHVWHK